MPIQERQQKEIPLANLGFMVDPERLGMFDAICNVHSLHHAVQDGKYIIVLTETSILDELYRHLLFSLMPLPGQAQKHDLLCQELSSLDHIN